MDPDDGQDFEEDELHCRVIGMNRGVTEEQKQAVREFLRNKAGKRRLKISWDGDPVRSGAFTEVIVPFVEDAHRGHPVSVLPRCLPDHDGSCTTRGDLAAGMIRHADPVSQEEFMAGFQILTERLGDTWHRAVGEDMQHYVTLAAAHRASSEPHAVVWIYDDDRSHDQFAHWACLAEFKAFATVESHVPYFIVTKSGEVLETHEAERLPWYHLSHEQIGWRSMAGNSGAS